MLERHSDLDIKNSLIIIGRNPVVFDVIILIVQSPLDDLARVLHKSRELLSLENQFFLLIRKLCRAIVPPKKKKGKNKIQKNQLSYRPLPSVPRTLPLYCTNEQPTYYPSLINSSLIFFRPNLPLQPLLLNLELSLQPRSHLTLCFTSVHFPIGVIAIGIQVRISI